MKVVAIRMWGYTAVALAVGVVVLIIVMCVCGKCILRIRSEGITYANAMRTSGETQKRLVVIGEPFRGWFGAGFGEGDVCVQSTAAAEWLAKQPANSAVVLLGEPLNNMAEVGRVAGDHLYPAY